MRDPVVGSLRQNSSPLALHEFYVVMGRRRDSNYDVLIVSGGRVGLRTFFGKFGVEEDDEIGRADVSKV